MVGMIMADALTLVVYKKKAGRPKPSPLAK